MGQHSKKEKCCVCNGTGKTKYSEDGNVVTIDCVACNGSGKQP